MEYGGGTAKDFYEQGVRLSFEQWDVEGASEYLADSLSTEADYVDNLGGLEAISVRCLR